MNTQEDFLININLEELQDFEFEFEDCENYELTVTPAIDGEQFNQTKYKHYFMFISVAEPPYNVTSRGIQILT